METPKHNHVDSRVLAAACVALVAAAPQFGLAQTTNINGTPPPLVNGFRRMGTNSSSFTLPARPQPGTPSIAAPPDELGPHYRAWTVRQPRVNPGRTNTASASRIGGTGRIIEMASGMNYFDGQVWRPSEPSFAQAQDATGAFVADHVQHRIRLESDLSAPNGVLTLAMPDGVVLHITPLAIGLFDAASGRAAIVATVTNSAAVLLASNEVLYPAGLAGAGVCADILEHLERGSFAQDVVFTGKFDVSAYGFPEATTRIQLISELISSRIPDRTRHPIRVELNQSLRQTMATPDFLDDTLGFGVGVMGPGFVSQGERRLPGPGTAPVGKELRVIDGRTLLFETVEWGSVKSWLRSLPDCQPAGGSPATGQYFKQATKGYASIPKRATLQARTVSQHPPGDLARLRARQATGVTLDWVLTLSGNGPTVFQSDVTYFISGPVYCGSVTIEPAVFKYPTFDGSSGAFIQVQGDVNLTTRSYAPATFTAGDDDTLGETLGPGSGWIWTGYTGDTTGKSYAAPALWLAGYQQTLSLSNVRFFYAQQAVLVDGWEGQDFALAHSQLVNCIMGVGLYGSDSRMCLNNCLFAHVNTPLDEANSGGYQGQWQMCHCTVDGGAQLLNQAPYWQSSLLCTNCIFANISDIGTDSSDGQNNGFYPSSAPQVGDETFTSSTWPFQTGGQGPYLYFQGGGHYYLADGSPFKQQGTTQIDPVLLTSLETKTTCPPLTLPSQMQLQGQLVLLPSPQVQRYKAGAPDLGYYYDALDYTIADVLEASGASVTVEPGTAIAVRNDYAYNDDMQNSYWTDAGFEIFGEATFISRGTPDRPITYTALRLVQEGPFEVGLNLAFSVDAFQTTTCASCSSPTLDLRFCNFSFAAEDYVMSAGAFALSDQTEDCSMNWQLHDCALSGGHITLGPPTGNMVYTNPYPNGAITWLNSSFERLAIFIEPTWYNPYRDRNFDLPFQAYNNLFRGGTIFLDQSPTSAGNWVLRDNLFDSAAFFQWSQDLVPDADHNAYWIIDAQNLPPWPFPYVNGSWTTHLISDLSNPDSFNGITLSAAPSYASGPFGRFYLSPSSPTYASLNSGGSRSPAAAGLYHYTTRTDQLKEANQNAVDIGVPYISASGTPPLPVDSDSDGIPDYVENWHGDGTYSLHVGTETDWLHQQTVIGIADSANSIYDGVDLDGDGLTGAAERFFGTNPLISDNPLQAFSPAGGTIDGTVQLPIPLSATIVAQITGASLLCTDLPADGTGSPALGLATGAQPLQIADGLGSIIWDTSCQWDAYHLACFAVDYGGQQPVFSPVWSVTTANEVTFPQPFDGFGAGLHIEAVAGPYSAYRIELQDGGGAPLSYNNNGTQTAFELTGYADGNGRISVDWDLTFPDSTTFNGPVVEGDFFVSDGILHGGWPCPIQGPEPTPCGKRIWKREPSWTDGSFLVARTYECPGDDVDKIWNALAATVVDVIGASANTYQLGPQPPDGAGNPHGETRYIPTAGGMLWPQTADDVFVLDSDTKQDFLNALTDGASRNLLWLGHGSGWGFGASKDELSDCPNYLNEWTGIKSSEVRTLLGNNESRAFEHPYRFVFIYGCCAASGDISQAFGIPCETGISVEDFVTRKVPPRAFVGAYAETSVSDVFDTAMRQSYSLTVFFNHWMAGDPLYMCLSRAQSSYDPNDLLDIGEEGADPPRIPFELEYQIYGAYNLTRS